MVNIIFRNYQEGDEQQLADLFNRAFQMNKYSPIRTPKTIIWRYLQSPNFEPEMCQIAEDINNKKIIGALYINLIEEISLNSKKFIVGEINDVCCHPDYTKRGIATNLMKRAINYMKKKRCDISMLTAEYKSVAREKIYLKYGYKDIDDLITFFQFPYLFKFIKDMAIFTFLFPVFFVISYFPRILNRMRIKINNFFKDFTYEIKENKKHFEYMNAVNEIIPKYYTGFPLYEKRKFKWARIDVPSQRHRPTYVFIRKKKNIIGGAVITHQNIYAFQYGIKIRIGIVHDIFLDKSQFNNKRNLHLGYVYLIDKMMKASTQRRIGLLIYMATTQDHDLIKGFRAMSFLKLRRDNIMMKTFGNINFPEFKKPLYIPTYVSIGVP